MLLKVKKDCQCDRETALAWAFSAKNCLINVNGFSPHQIVFGKNITLPSIFTDQPSADLPENEIVIKHLNTLHATRQAFITAEFSRKLKLALRKQRRNTTDFFEIGGKVYFKRNIDKKWHGPGHAIGQCGAIVYIRQGGILYKAHGSRTQLITDFEHPPTFNTVNLPANNDNLQTDKTLQKTNPNTTNCDSDDEIYDGKPVKVMKLLMKI